MFVEGPTDNGLRLISQQMALNDTSKIGVHLGQMRTWLLALVSCPEKAIANGSWQ